MSLDRKQAAAKSRILAKGRKIESDIRRYAAFGYVTDIESWESDDRRLVRAVDGLYESARKEGIHDDPELMRLREALRLARIESRERAFISRKQLREGQSGAFDKRKVPGGMQGYLDEISIAEAKRSARRKGGGS